jgi:hypothetical protein
MENQMIIYSTFHSSRLTYVLDYVFEEVLGIRITHTTDETEFLAANVFKLNYSHRPLMCDLHIDSLGLLDETEIVEKEIQVDLWRGLPIFFATSAEPIPFDLFSAIFYLISRYEEYLPYEPDAFRRFPHAQSLAYKEGFLDKPIIDFWLLEFESILKQLHPSFTFKENKFSFLPTYDIDIAYSYRGKGLMRNGGGILKDIANGHVENVKQRLHVLFGNAKDPYDSYAWLDNLHKKYNLNPLYFLLLSEGGALDKNLHPSTKEMKELIHTLQMKYDVGIHPSWQSHEHVDVLRSEYNRLPETQHSRQHYIRFTLPETFRNLLAIGIRKEYSMGYGSTNGFRASTSRPFRWFDLERNEATSLQCIPFCFMECNSFFEQGFSSEQAKQELLAFANMVHKVKGQLVTVFHNFSLGTEPLWKGWKEMYEECVSRISNIS